MMKRNSRQLDQHIQNQLDVWESKVGRPTCSAGCSNCCRHTTVIISPPEALRILEYVSDLPAEKGAFFRNRWKERMERLERQLNTGVENEQEAVSTLLNFGSCAFLDGHLCGVYSARPDACRSFYVWHSADKCGQPNIEMCPPAELAQLRIEQFYATLLEEAEAGRLPFWGHLLVMVGLMDQHRDAYLDGADLSQVLAPIWSKTGLIHFIKPENTAEGIVSFLKREQVEYAKLFAEEPWPMGLPRVTNARDRNDLDAFILDPNWL